MDGPTASSKWRRRVLMVSAVAALVAALIVVLILSQVGEFRAVIALVAAACIMGAVIAAFAVRNRLARERKWTATRLQDMAERIETKEYKDYVHRFEHEHELIDRKVAWLLTSQTLLFAALGFSLEDSSEAFVRIVAAVGLVICAVIIVGLVGNILAKYLAYCDYMQLVGTNEVDFGVRGFTTRLGIFTDLAIPGTFALAWMVVLYFSADLVSA